jgi:hypothetical protein
MNETARASFVVGALPERRHVDRVLCSVVGNRNRKAGRDEKARATRIIEEAYPGMRPIWGAHGDYGGHRAPRDHTIAFRLQDDRGRFCSNVIWVMPDQLATLTVEQVRAMVGNAGA